MWLHGSCGHQNLRRNKIERTDGAEEESTRDEENEPLSAARPKGIDAPDDYAVSNDGLQ